VNSVTVRQVPFTEIESPRVQSLRMEEQLEIVIVVPPPEVASWGRSSETAVRTVGVSGGFCVVGGQMGDGAYCLGFRRCR